MAKKKIVTVIGTRPQFIKYSVLSESINRNFNEILIDTGQHYSKNLSDFLISELNFKQPKIRLNIKDSGPLEQISGMVRNLFHIFRKEEPDAMICFGDTNSTLAASITAVKMDIPFAHVEAGERNFDAKGKICHPASIPEETNRTITDELSSLLLCSTKRAVINLNAEKIKGEIKFTGDIMYDLYLNSIKSVIKKSKILEMLNLKPKSYYFCTVHRAINTDSKDRMTGLYRALKNLSLPVVLPVHPRTRKALEKYNLYSKFLKLKNLKLLEPVGYKDSLMLNYNSACVLTDSGGVVREAYFSGVPSIMLDDTSEWQDLYESRWSVIAGANTNKIINAVKKLKTPKSRSSFFGNGDAVNKTIIAIKNWLN